MLVEFPQFIPRCLRWDTECSADSRNTSTDWLDPGRLSLSCTFILVAKIWSGHLKDKLGESSSVCSFVYHWEREFRHPLFYDVAASLTESLGDHDLLQLPFIEFDAQPRSFRHHRHPGFELQRLLEQDITPRRANICGIVYIAAFHDHRIRRGNS